jgi:hypothetical protein
MFAPLRNQIIKKCININSHLNRRIARSFGGASHGSGAHGHGHDEPHAPEGHKKVGSVFLIFTYFWVMYRLKEDKGQLFGLYYPWLDEHEHEHNEHKFSEVEFGGGVPERIEPEDHDDEHEHEEEAEDEEE